MLPFDNLSGNKDDDYLCDGFTEDIAADLAKFSDLLVIAPYSAFVYRNEPLEPSDIGEKLSADYLLKGSVQQTQPTFRINVQLIETQTGRCLWTERFERRSKKLLAVRDELVRRIVLSLALNIDATERNRAARAETEIPSAYEAYLRGKHHWWLYMNSTGSREMLQESLYWFEEATIQDPSYARAWAWLTYPHLHSWLEGWADNSAMENAGRCAKKAVSLDGLEYVAHWALAYFHLYSGDVDTAIHEYKAAIALNPNEANMLVEMSEALCYAGMHRQALSNVRTAMKINPHFPDWYRTNLAMARYFLKDYGRALQELNLVVRPSSDDHLLMACLHARKAESLEHEDDNDVEAERAQAAAATALASYLDAKPEWSIFKEERRLHFKRAADKEHWLEGLRMAGLPADEVWHRPAPAQRNQFKAALCDDNHTAKH